MKRKFDKFFKVVVMVLLTVIALKDFGCNHSTVEVAKYFPKIEVKPETNVYPISEPKYVILLGLLILCYQKSTHWSK